LDRVWQAPETLADEAAQMTMGAMTGQAVREIQNAYVAVLLVGAKRVREAAQAARRAAWALNDGLNSGRKQRGLENLATLFDAFSAAAAAFVRAAGDEFS
jgi:hypothetical protein